MTGEELIAAIKAADLSDSPFGDVSFDDYNNLVGPVMIREVVKRDDGKLWNEVVEQYEGVSQFWNDDPEEFLAQPPFSQTQTGR